MLDSERFDLYTCRNERHDRRDPQPARAVGARGGARPRTSHGILPPPGANVAVIGCGTSWFMAQAYAALREGCGHGRTDAFAASEMPSRPVRRRRRALALGHDDRGRARARCARRARARSPITAVPDTPVAVRRRRRRAARVRRRAVGRADALRDHRAQPAARPRGLRPRRGRSPTPRDRARRAAPGRARRGRPLGVPRPRLDRRAGQRGGAQAARVGPGVDRGLPGLRVPPRPDQHRRPGRRRVVLRAGRRGVLESVRAAGAHRRRARPRPARLARARPADRGRARRGRRARPRPPAQPDPLRRPHRRCRSDPHQPPRRAGRGRRPGAAAAAGAASDDEKSGGVTSRSRCGTGRTTSPARCSASSPTTSTRRTRHQGQGDDRRRGRRPDAPEGDDRAGVRRVPGHRLHLRLGPRQPGTLRQGARPHRRREEARLPLGRLLRAGQGGDHRQRQACGRCRR